MEDKETPETVEEYEDPEFVCNRCHRPFDPIKWRCIVRVWDKKSCVRDVSSCCFPDRVIDDSH